jgi:hypothetical protein
MYRNVIDVLKNEEFVRQVGEKDYYYIRMHGQQNIKILWEVATLKVTMSILPTFRIRKE